MTYEQAMEKAREGRRVWLPGMVQHWDIVYELGGYWKRSMLTGQMVTYVPGDDVKRRDWKDRGSWN